MLLKPGKSPQTSDDYSPITLLFSFGKAFERCIRHLEEKCLLNSSQFSFRAGWSTEETVNRVTDGINTELENNAVVAAFLHQSLLGRSS